MPQEVSENFAREQVQEIQEREARQVEEAVKPETAKVDAVIVGGKDIRIVPMVRRWQHLFFQAALPLYKAELGTTEAIAKMFSAGTADFMSMTDTLIDGEIEMDKHLDEAAAVVLASKIPGAEKDPQKVIAEQVEWIQGNARTEELRTLVEKQADKEMLIKSVGERLPVRFARSLNLAGNREATPDTVKRRLNSFFAKLPELNGDGN